MRSTCTAACVPPIPSPYLYYFKLKDYEIVGASPEMLVNVTKGIVSTKPIAGTSKRGLTEAQDKELERDLLKDPKEKAEHTMLVDLGRNDVGKVSKFGTVEVTSFMKVERYSQVMHIVSDVKGMLRDNKTALDALLSVLPGGHALRRAKSARNGDHRRTGTHQTRTVRRHGRLSRL